MGEARRFGVEVKIIDIDGNVNNIGTDTDVVLKSCGNQCPAYKKIFSGDECLLYKKDITFEFYTKEDGFPAFCKLPAVDVNEKIKKEE